jgi:hypothetical protein
MAINGNKFLTTTTTTTQKVIHYLQTNHAANTTSNTACCIRSPQLFFQIFIFKKKVRYNNDLGVLDLNH